MLFSNLISVDLAGFGYGSVSGVLVPVDDTFTTAAFASETSEAVISLLTISHGTLETPLRFVRNGINVESRGDIYLAYPFDIDLPAQDSERPPKTTLRIDNVDRQIVETLRTIVGPPTVVLEVVLASDPDVVEVGPFQFTLRNASYDMLTVEGELAFNEVLGRRFPFGTFTPASHPGLTG